MFAPRKTKEVGIGMARPFGAVDFVEVFKRELHPPSQSLNAIPKFARLERREFVKERLDNQRNQKDHDHLECHPTLGVSLSLSNEYWERHCGDGICTHMKATR